MSDLITVETSSGTVVDGPRWGVHFCTYDPPARIVGGGLQPSAPLAQVLLDMESRQVHLSPTETRELAAAPCPRGGQRARSASTTA